jgi:hypothetical protein
VGRRSAARRSGGAPKRQGFTLQIAVRLLRHGFFNVIGYQRLGGIRKIPLCVCPSLRPTQDQNALRPTQLHQVRRGYYEWLGQRARSSLQIRRIGENGKNRKKQKNMRKHLFVDDIIYGIKI